METSLRLMHFLSLIYGLSLIILFSSGTSPSENEEPFLGREMAGRASFYGPKFHGKKTANGEKMDQFELTCAHKDLPFDTMLEVRYPKKGTKVIVRVNDRGPFIKGRIIDVSFAAAKVLKMIDDGVGTVEATIVGQGGKVLIETSNPFSKLLISNVLEDITGSLK